VLAAGAIFIINSKVLLIAADTILLLVAADTAALQAATWHKTVFWFVLQQGSCLLPEVACARHVRKSVCCVHAFNAINSAYVYYTAYYDAA
jgi:hypothetical protein